MDGSWDPETPNLVPSVAGGHSYYPPYQEAPGIESEYAVALRMRDLTMRAYMKALKAGKEYTAEGMNLKRYDIAALRAEYIFWRDQVDTIARHGNSSTMVWKHVIPYF
jgi:hypothetical protein